MVVACAVHAAAIVRASEITVMTSGAFAAAYRELSAQFEREPGQGRDRGDVDGRRQRVDCESD